MWPQDVQCGRKSLFPRRKKCPFKIDSKDRILKYIIRSECVTSRGSSFVVLKFCLTQELSRVNYSLQQERLLLSLTLIQQIFQGSGFIRTAELLFRVTFQPTSCLTAISLSSSKQTQVQRCGPSRKIIILQCDKWTILFVWQQRINHKSCVAVQKIKLSFGHCPRTSICQNKCISFSK